VTETLERPTETALPWRQRYQRWTRVHQRRASKEAVVGAVLCLAVVLTLAFTGPRAAAPAPPADDGGEHLLSIAMVGDIMFGRHVEEVTSRRGMDFPLSHVTDHLATADFVTGNLEQAIRLDPSGTEYQEADKFIHLATGPEPLDALRDAGFTHLNLANNHTMDYGEAGLMDTLTALDDAGLQQIGAGTDVIDATDIHYDEIGGLTVAWLGFTDVLVAGFAAHPFGAGVLPAEPEIVGPTIREAAQEADLVIVHIHWGEEYDWRPNRRQVELGRQMVDEGADIVIGHHPHVLMPVEHHGDGLIFYSLGNFVFDQGWTRTRESAIVNYRLAEDGTATVELVPVFVREARPRPVQGWTGRYRQERIFQQLTARTDGWERHGDVLRRDFDHAHVFGGADGE
jgi:gamma-polyglutamate biosynthesis protein CapA